MRKTIVSACLIVMCSYKAVMAEESGKWGLYPPLSSQGSDKAESGKFEFHCVIFRDPNLAVDEDGKKVVPADLRLVVQQRKEAGCDMTDWEAIMSEGQ